MTNIVAITAANARRWQVAKIVPKRQAEVNAVAISADHLEGRGLFAVHGEAQAPPDVQRVDNDHALAGAELPFHAALGVSLWWRPPCGVSFKYGNCPYG